MLDDACPPRSRQRWFQFSLRELLLVTALLAVFVAWQGEHIVRWVESWRVVRQAAGPADDRYRRFGVIGPITSGALSQALPPPTEDEILDALAEEPEARWFVTEAKRNRGRMTLEQLADYVDPPRLYPILSQAQNHHTHYRCEVTDGDTAATIHIDHYHFHVVEAKSRDE